VCVCVKIKYCQGRVECRRFLWVSVQEICDTVLVRYLMSTFSDPVTVHIQIVCSQIL